MNNNRILAMSIPHEQDPLWYPLGAPQQKRAPTPVSTTAANWAKIGRYGNSLPRSSGINITPLPRLPAHGPNEGYAGRPEPSPFTRPPPFTLQVAPSGTKTADLFQEEAFEKRRKNAAQRSMETARGANIVGKSAQRNKNRVIMLPPTNTKSSRKNRK